MDIEDIKISEDSKLLNPFQINDLSYSLLENSEGTKRYLYKQLNHDFNNPNSTIHLNM